MQFATIDSALYLVSQKGDDEWTGAMVHENSAFAYDHWDDTIATASRLDAASVVSVDASQFGPPSTKPSQVFAVGLNYRAHADETGSAYPEAPNVFTKWASCLTGPFGDIELPSDTVDWECELVVVMGRITQFVSEADAWGYAAGLCVGQDISERTVQRTAPANQFSPGKSFASFGPMGPVLVTVDELRTRGLNPDDLEISTKINAEMVQHSRTSDMIFSVPQIIAYLSRIVTLRPGDVIFTGTPSGVGVAQSPQRWLQAGEEVVTEIEGLGQMRHRCVAAAHQFR